MKIILVVLFIVVGICGYGQHKNDTVKVVMLFSDTVFNGKQIVHPTSIGFKPVCYWQYGYVVYQFLSGHWYKQDYYISDQYEVKDYLDINKKKLPKSIIIWQTININD